MALLIPVVMVIVGPFMIKDQSRMLRRRASKKKPAKSRSGNKPPRRRPSPSSEE